MPTPRAAQHRDLQAKLSDLDRQLREIRSTLLRRARLEVTEGDFNVTGGGSIQVRDGGSVEVRGGGDVDVRGGNLITDGEVRVEDDGYMRWYDDTGQSRVTIGGLTDGEDGPVVAHGLLIDGPEPGLDNVMYADNRGVSIMSVYGRGSNDWPLLLTEDGWPDQLNLHDQDGERYLSTGLTNEDNAGIWGGKEGDGSLSVLLQFMGAQNGSRAFRLRDGANSVYADLECGAVTEHTSSEATKDVLGDPDDDPVATVQSVPVKRWRHKLGGRSATPDGVVADNEDTPPERTGPMVEDLPEQLVKRSDGGDGIRVSEALWTLWRAVQQLTGERDELRTQLDALSERVAALEASRD